MMPTAASSRFVVFLALALCALGDDSEEFDDSEDEDTVQEMRYPHVYTPEVLGSNYTSIVTFVLTRYEP